MEDFWGNVVAGLASALLIWVLVELFGRGWLVPKVQAMLYSGVKIAGTWEIEYHGTAAREIARLKQSAGKITGTITVSAGNDCGKHYTVDGSLRDSILTLTYQTEDEKAFDRGCIVAIVNGNGGHMDGHTALYYDPTHKIHGYVVTFTRKN